MCLRIKCFPCESQVAAEQPENVRTQRLRFGLNWLWQSLCLRSYYGCQSAFFIKCLSPSYGRSLKSLVTFHMRQQLALANG